MGPRLVLAASLWTLEGHPSPGRREWSLDRKLETIASEGFTAVTGPVSPGLRQKLARYGLRFSGVAAAGTIAEFRRLLRQHAEEGAESLTVQIRPATLSPSQALARTRGFFREAERLNMPLFLETHRGTITESPEALLLLADSFQKAEGSLLPLTWDPSHLATVRHLKPFQFSEFLLSRPELIQRSTFFHARPFNGQHAQVPICHPPGKLTVEGRDWLRFQEDLLRCWLAGNAQTPELWICPEIGPVGIHGYNVSTMPSSWSQALDAAREIKRLWKKLNSRHAQA